MAKKIVIGESDSRGKDEAYCTWYTCPNAKCSYSDIARDHKYCPSCGSKLIWTSGED